METPISSRCLIHPSSMLVPFLSIPRSTTDLWKTSTHGGIKTKVLEQACVLWSHTLRLLLILDPGNVLNPYNLREQGVVDSISKSLNAVHGTLKTLWKPQRSEERSQENWKI